MKKELSFLEKIGYYVVAPAGVLLMIASFTSDNTSKLTQKEQAQADCAKSQDLGSARCNLYLNYYHNK